MSKEQTNYERLVDNKTKVLEFADSVISSNKPITGKLIDENITTPYKISLSTQAIEDAVAKGDFTSAIAKLDERKDNKLGIVWHVSEDLGVGTKALVRDARFMTKDAGLLKKDAAEKYGMQLLNNIRAANMLIGEDSGGLNKNNAAKEQLQFLANKAIKDIDKLSSSTILEYNTIVMDILKQSGISNAKEEMTFAKEIANFQDEHKHIVTLTTAKDNQGKSHTVTEAEIMLNGLTEKQKVQFRAIGEFATAESRLFNSLTIGQQELIKEVINQPKRDLEQYNTLLNSLTLKQKEQLEAIEKSASPESHYNTLIKAAQFKEQLGDMSWYNDMPPYKKALLEKVAADIATGNKVIPTQMLGNLPCLKNAYLKLTAIGEVKDAKSKIIAESFHSGTPATKIKKGSQEIVSENIKQLQSFLPEGSKVNLNILNSKARGETFIFDQLAAAQKKDKFLISASPINRWRFFGSGRNQEVFNQSLQNVGKQLEGVENAKNIATFLQKGNSWFSSSRIKKATKELENLRDPDLAKSLKAAIDAKELLGKNNFLNSFNQNINLSISNKMDLVNSSINLEGGALNKLAKETTSENVSLVTEKVVSLTFCKSGKDRTGLVELGTTYEAVSNYLNIEPNSALAKENLITLGAGGHTQEMAGVQGGSIGCHSIKTNPEFGIPANMQELNGIINQNSSKFNTKVKVLNKVNFFSKPFVKDKSKSVVQDFTNDFANEFAKHQTTFKETREIEAIKPVSEKLNINVEKIKTNLKERSKKTVTFAIPNNQELKNRKSENIR